MSLLQGAQAKAERPVQEVQQGRSLMGIPGRPIFTSRPYDRLCGPSGATQLRQPHHPPVRRSDGSGDKVHGDGSRPLGGPPSPRRPFSG